MEEKIKNSHVLELTLEEKKKINGGTEREDSKLSGWFEKLWDIFTN